MEGRGMALDPSLLPSSPVVGSTIGNPSLSTLHWTTVPPYYDSQSSQASSCPGQRHAHSMVWRHSTSANGSAGPVTPVAAATSNFQSQKNQKGNTSSGSKLQVVVYGGMQGEEEHLYNDVWLGTLTIKNQNTSGGKSESEEASGKKTAKKKHSSTNTCTSSASPFSSSSFPCRAMHPNSNPFTNMYVTWQQVWPQYSYPSSSSSSQKKNKGKASISSIQQQQQQQHEAPQSRWGHTAHMISQNEMLVIGGFPTKSLEFYAFHCEKKMWRSVSPFCCAPASIGTHGTIHREKGNGGGVTGISSSRHPLPRPSAAFHRNVTEDSVEANSYQASSSPTMAVPGGSEEGTTRGSSCMLLGSVDDHTVAPSPSARRSSANTDAFSKLNNSTLGTTTTNTTTTTTDMEDMRGEDLYGDYTIHSSSSDTASDSSPLLEESTESEEDMTAMRYNHSSVVARDAIYIFGGLKSPSECFSSDLLCAEFLTNKRKSSMSSILRQSLEMEQLQQQGVKNPGAGPGAVGTGNPVALSSFHPFRYSFQSRECTATENLLVISKCQTTGTAPSPRFGHGACVVDGSMYLFGGTDASDVDDISFHQLFQVSLDTFVWQVLECSCGLGIPIMSPTHQGNLGGDPRSGSPCSSTGISSEAKTPTTESTPTAQHPGGMVTAASSQRRCEKPIGRLSHCLFADEEYGSIYLVGGFLSQEMEEPDHVYVFDIARRRWTAMRSQSGPYPKSISSMAVLVLPPGSLVPRQQQQQQQRSSSDPQNETLSSLPYSLPEDFHVCFFAGEDVQAESMNDVTGLLVSSSTRAQLGIAKKFPTSFESQIIATPTAATTTTPEALGSAVEPSLVPSGTPTSTVSPTVSAACSCWPSIYKTSFAALIEAAEKAVAAKAEEQQRQREDMQRQQQQQQQPFIDSHPNHSFETAERPEASTHGRGAGEGGTTMSNTCSSNQTSLVASATASMTMTHEDQTPSNLSQLAAEGALIAANLQQQHQAQQPGTKQSINNNNNNIEKSNEKTVSGVPSNPSHQDNKMKVASNGDDSSMHPAAAATHISATTTTSTITNVSSLNNIFLTLLSSVQQMQHDMHTRFHSIERRIDELGYRVDEVRMGMIESQSREFVIQQQREQFLLHANDSQHLSQQQQQQQVPVFHQPPLHSTASWQQQDVQGFVHSPPRNDNMYTSENSQGYHPYVEGAMYPGNTQSPPRTDGGVGVAAGVGEPQSFQVPVQQAVYPAVVGRGRAGGYHTNGGQRGGGGGERNRPAMSLFQSPPDRHSQQQQQQYLSSHWEGLSGHNFNTAAAPQSRMFHHGSDASRGTDSRTGTSPMGWASLDHSHASTSTAPPGLAAQSNSNHSTYHNSVQEQQLPQQQIPFVHVASSQPFIPNTERKTEKEEEEGILGAVLQQQQQPPISIAAASTTGGVISHQQEQVIMTHVVKDVRGGQQL